MMMSSDHGKVSVIIPVYNVKDYLERCVDSVLEQTYSDLEVWLVDDGSTDGCGEICDRYAETDRRVTAIHQENKGQSCARNTAIEKSTGEYILFVDSDDYIKTVTIETLIDALVDEKADMAVCGIRYGTEEHFQGEKEKTGYKTYTGRERYVTLFSEGCRRIMSAACGKLYRASVFETIRFPEGKIYEDEFTIHHILGKCTRCVIIEEELYYHFVRTDSTTRQSYTMKSLDAVEAINDRCRYFEDYGDEELLFMAYRDYLRRVQFHYYSLKRYFSDEIDEISEIVKRYKEYYEKIYFQMTAIERIRFGLFIYFPQLNRVLKSMAGARKI